MGGMGTRGWGGFACKSKGMGGWWGALAEKGLCHLLILLLQILLLILFYSLVTVGGFQFHHLFFFSVFFVVVGYLNYIFIRLRYLSNDIFLLMYIIKK